MIFLLLEILAVAVLALLTLRLVPQPWRGRLLNLLKLWVTVRVFWLLLTHPVRLEDGTRVLAYRLVLDTLARIDAGTFWTFCALAAGVKFVGILSSMYRWTILLRGQGIDLPFRHIFGSFLIGRFIGTFLPSTAGLDGYKLYDAARFSGKTVEVTATTALEKVIGFSGIFLSFLVALPFGIKIFGEQRTRSSPRITVPFCIGADRGAAAAALVPGPDPVVPRAPADSRARRGSSGLVMRISHAAAAYRDKKPLVARRLRALLRGALHDGRHVLLHGARDRRGRRRVLADRLRLLDPDPRDRALAVHDRGRGHPRGRAVRCCSAT